MLLDEPAAGLEDNEISGLIETIRSYREAGMAFVVVDHRLDFLLATIDRAVCLVGGEVTFDGTAEQLVSDSSFLNDYLGVVG